MISNFLGFRFIITVLFLPQNQDSYRKIDYSDHEIDTRKHP